MNYVPNFLSTCNFCLNIVLLHLHMFVFSVNLVISKLMMSKCYMRNLAINMVLYAICFGERNTSNVTM